YRGTLRGLLQGQVKIDGARNLRSALGSQLSALRGTCSVCFRSLENREQMMGLLDSVLGRTKAAEYRRSLWPLSGYWRTTRSRAKGDWGRCPAPRPAPLLAKLHRHPAVLGAC